MKKTAVENKNKGLLWVSAATSVVMITLIFKAAHRFPGDNHIFMYGDYLVQFMEYIVMFWRKLFSGNGLFYSFDLGMGAATWEHYSFYGFSPFNLIFVLIGDADTAAFVLLLLKVCAAAVCMHLFLRHALRVRESIAVLFSVSYALCAYVINFHFCIILLDYLYLLPIVMLAMSRLFRTGKAGGLAAAYAFAFLVSYYGGYMTGVYSFVCFMVMLLFGEYGFSKKKLLVRYTLAVILAVIISSVVTLPTAMAIIAGRNGESGTAVQFKMLIWEVIADLYPLRDINEATLQPSIYCGLPAFVCFIGYCIDKDIRKREKAAVMIPLVFLLICTLFKPAYLMMHGFDEPDGYFFRFAFIICFWLTTIGARWLEKKDDNIRILPFVVVTLAEVMIMITGYIFPDMGEYYPGITETAIVLFFMLIYYMVFKNVKKLRYEAVFLVLLSELFLNAYFAITPDSYKLVRWKETYELWNRHGTEALNEIGGLEEAEGDGQFYRINYRDGIWTNDAMYFGYHDLSYFSSMEQRDLRQLLHDIGYSTSGRVVFEKGGSPFTEMIFSQKYRVVTDPDIRNEGCEKVDVTRNEYVLPLAFMVSDDTEKINFVNDAFENQQRLADAMLGHGNTIWDRYTGIISNECDNVSLTEYNGGYTVRRETDGEGILTLSVDAGESDEWYSYLSTGYNNLELNSPVVYSDAEGVDLGLIRSATLYIPAIIKLGNEAGRAKLYIKLRNEADDEGSFEQALFAKYNESGVRNAYDELESGGLIISEMKDDDIRGHITVQKDKEVLFTSIPYDENWHIQADGNETETFPVLNGAFLACRLPVGEHEIRMYYDNKFIKTGAIVSFMGILLLLGMVIYEKKHSLKEVENGGGAEDTEV